MPEFTPVWLDPDDVRHWLRLNAAASPPDVLEAAEVDRVCAQVEVYVQRCRPDAWVTTGNTDPDPPVVTYVPDAEIYQAAVMLAGKVLRRRASPGGVESFGDVGIAFVAKYDPEVERMLRTGGWALPGVG